MCASGVRRGGLRNQRLPTMQERREDERAAEQIAIPLRGCFGACGDWCPDCLGLHAPAATG